MTLRELLVELRKLSDKELDQPARVETESNFFEVAEVAVAYDGETGATPIVLFAQ